MSVDYNGLQYYIILQSLEWAVINGVDLHELPLTTYVRCQLLGRGYYSYLSSAIVYNKIL